MRMAKIYLDGKGYEQYESEITTIKAQIIATQKEKSEAAGQAHDWHDNAGFEYAVQEETKLRQQLQILIGKKKDIEIIERGENRNIADIGDIVNAEVEYAPDDIEISNFHLTGNYAINTNMFDDPMEVSLNSPIGSAIYQKGVGSKFSYDVGNNKVTGTIKSIEELKDASK